MRAREDGEQHRVQRDDDRGDRHDEANDEPAGLTPRRRLMREEVHEEPRCRDQLKLILGASRASGFAISSKDAG